MSPLLPSMREPAVGVPLDADTCEQVTTLAYDITLAGETLLAAEDEGSTMTTTPVHDHLKNAPRFGAQSAVEPMTCADGFWMDVQASSRAYCKPQTDQGPWTHVELTHVSHEDELLLADYRGVRHQTGAWADIPIEVVEAIYAKHQVAEASVGAAMSSQATIDAIARRHLGVDTLTPQGSDELDFHTVSVWSVRRALEDAVLLGHAQAQKEVK